MNEIIEILGLACISVLFTNAEPIIAIRESIGLTKTQIIPLFILNKILSCCKCLNFWLTLSMTGNIYLAAIGSILAITINKIIINKFTIN